MDVTSWHEIVHFSQTLHHSGWIAHFSLNAPNLTSSYILESTTVQIKHHLSFEVLMIIPTDHWNNFATSIECFCHYPVTMHAMIVLDIIA